MKLISCGSCGVVLDTNRINKPKMYDRESVIIYENVGWYNGDY